MRLRKAVKALAGAALCLSLPGVAMAELPGVAKLAHVLRVENGGMITRVFHGPDDFTGVMLDYHGQQAMGFITPNGKWLMVGMMMNLDTGEMINQELLAEQLKKQGIVVGMRAMEAIGLAARMPAITYGPEDAKNTITVICDPDRMDGKTVIVKMLHLMEKFYQETPALQSKMAMRVIPVGKTAAWLLSGSNLDDLRRLKEVIEDKTKGGKPDSTGTSNANRDQDALRNFPMPPPFVLMNLPEGRMEFLMNAKNAVKTLRRAESGGSATANKGK